MGEIARQTFIGGPGMVLVQLMFTAVAGWLLGYIAQAAGKGQVAGMIHVTTIFTCIGLVANTAFNAIGKVATAMGIGW